MSVLRRGLVLLEGDGHHPIVDRGSSRVQTAYLSARNGAWDVKTTYASRYRADTWDTRFGAGQISTGYGLGYDFEGQKSFSRSSYC